MSFADIKRDARRQVHAQFAVPAIYRDGETANGLPVDLAVRMHSQRVVTVGDENHGGWAEVLDHIDRLVFNREELASKRVLLRHGGRVVFPDYGAAAYFLAAEEPADGPIAVAWRVTREKSPK